MPIGEALEHASTLLFYSKKLAMEAAMDVRGEHYARAAHYLCEMSKAMTPRSQANTGRMWEEPCPR
jgi:hypothetical protein